MRTILGLSALLGVLAMSAAAEAGTSEDVPSPDGEAKTIVVQPKPPIDPWAVSNAVKSSVNGLLTFNGLTVMFRPSLSGIALRIRGRF